jgi:hypothetical protein
MMETILDGYGCPMVEVDMETGSSLNLEVKFRSLFRKTKVCPHDTAPGVKERSNSRACPEVIPKESA